LERKPSRRAGMSASAELLVGESYVKLHYFCHNFVSWNITR